MHDAYNLSSLILDDHFASPAPNSASSPLHMTPQDGLPDAVVRAIKDRTVVDLIGWKKIDEAEKERARRSGSGKEREKFTKIVDMLAVLA